MGWSLGYDGAWQRFIGYGVPAYCDHPGCEETIDRGLAYVCCEQQPYGGDEGCGLYFCAVHRTWNGKCARCAPLDDVETAPPDWEPFAPKPEHPEWLQHLLNDESWAQWRGENPLEVAKLREMASK